MTNFLSPNKQNVLRNQTGMTLIEIMIVIAILGGLMAILVPRFMGQKDKANVGQAKIQMGQIANALSMYYNDCGKFPTSLDNLITADPACTNWGPEAYIKSTPLDPWRNPFGYEVSGAEYTLKSFGKDGREGGSGYNADIPYEQ